MLGPRASRPGLFKSRCWQCLDVSVWEETLDAVKRWEVTHWKVKHPVFSPGFCRFISKDVNKECNSAHMEGVNDEDIFGD